MTTIVVVDDDEDYRFAVCILLRTMAATVSVVAEAADGEEALVVVRRERPTIVITDLIMPRLNGVDLTRRIRQELPHTKIILMSSHTEDAYRLLASDSGADVFLNKQVLVTSLLPAIHDISSRRLGNESAGTTTLGDLLYAKNTKTPVAETEWVGLVQSIAGGDQLALQTLYQQTHRVVFTLIVRITNNRDTAEDLTVDLFDDVWRTGASAYDPAGRSVVAWITNQARSRAIDRVRFERQMTRVNYQRASLLSRTASSGPQEDFEQDVLRPSAFLWEGLARRIGVETGPKPVAPASQVRPEPEWEEAGPGISCKLLATDTEKHRVSMLVRLAPGAAYPPHHHAGVEELYLLHGELVIDERKLYPGDYNRAEAGSADQLVWSETGCTCVLLTSTQDVLR